jgi:hypothetical protein
MSKKLRVTENKQGLMISQKQSYFHMGYLLPISTFVFFTSLISLSGLGWGVSIVMAIIGLIYRDKDIVFSKKNIIIKKDREFVLVEDKDTGWSFPARYAAFRKNIKHIFVKAYHSRRKNSSYYEIWIETDEGKQIRILGDKKYFVIKSRNEAELIVEKMKGLSIIIGYKPKTESLSQKKTKLKISARAITKEQELSKLQIQDLREGTLLDYKLQTWEVVQQVQYDWGQGNTDILYRLKSTEDKYILLLVVQNLAVYQTWIEERLTYQELLNDNLNKIRFEPPLELNFKGKELFKEYIEVGYEFVDNADFGAKITQYKYLSEDGKYSLRILHHEGEDVFVFSGVRAENFEFSNILLA